MVQYSTRLDRGFFALSDPTRRAFLERLARQEASLGQLAEARGMTLTGARKHVRVLEEAGLVKTRKVGRVRICMLGSRRFSEEVAWLNHYREMLEGRMDRLGEFLERTKGQQR